MMLFPILNNITLMVTLSVVYVLVGRYLDQSSKRVQILSGVVFGAFVILGLYNSVELEPGVIFDGRSIILSVAGLFGGPVVGIIAGVMALAYRLWIGGSGVLMGSLVIFESVFLGIFFHYFIQKKPKIPAFLLYFIMGFLVHVLMVVLIITLPEGIRTHTFTNVFIPVLVLYPIASFLVCVLFHTQGRYLNLVKELSESEGRFKQLFDENHMAFMVIDPDTKQIKNANKAAAKYYGYSVDELKSMKISQINTLEQSELGFRMSLAFENMQNRFVMQHKLASGEIRDVEVFSGPVDYDGKTHLYSIVSDVTERLKIENKLKQSELSYRELFNAVKDAIYIQDRNGVFLDVNDGVVAMYGYPKEFYIGKDPSALSAPGKNDLAELKKSLDLAQEGHEVGFEFWGKKKNGQIFPKYVRIYKTKYFGNDAFIAIGHDITHRKAAQRELEESRFNLNVLINVSDDIILLLDVNGNILTYNKAFSKSYGSAKDYKGENLFTVLSGSEAFEMEKYFKNVIETRKPISFEGFANEKNWWITFYPILNEKATVERIAVYSQDITLQRRMFNLQKNLQVAEKSAQLKQQFLSNMSHEMRTPMNGIIGMAELMASTPLTETQSDYLATIKESSSTLLSLINDILDLAKFESGKMPLHLTNVSLKDLETKIIHLFRQSANTKGVQFEIDITSDLPETLVTDEKRLTQVLVNMIGNALKFTTKGFVKVKGEPVQRNNAGARLFKFTVEDSGIGIDEDFRGRIFDEFAQLDTSKTRKYEGSGLGLAISKRIVELLGGKIGVDSVKGKGSKFWFTIKPGDAAEAGQVKKESGPYYFEPLGLNVLMVEDKIINRKVASLILKNMGCHVDTAENGLIGVDMVMKNTYDVVLMDIQMPVMDGITAVQAIRKSSRKQPAIIGLSAEAMHGDAEKYIGMGMDDYITKPIVPAVLYEKLSAIKNESKG